LASNIEFIFFPEFLKQFFKSEKNKAGKVKTRKKKPPVNDFKFSDDEVDENERPKKVSFLKKRETSPKRSSDVAQSNDTVDKYRDLKHEKDTLSKYAASRKEWSPSLKSEKELARSHSDSNDPWHKRDSTDDEHRTTPRPRERKLRSTHSTGSLTDGDTPKPKPRQRTLKGSSPSREDSLGSNEETLSRQATSSVSIPLSPTTRSTATSASETQRKLKSPSPKSSPPKSPTSPTISSRFSRYPSSLGDSRHFESTLSKSNNGSAFEDSDNTEDSDPEENKDAKEVQRKSPTLMELMMGKTETSEMSKALSRHDKIIGISGSTSPRMEERRKKKFGSTHLKGITKDSSEDEDGDEPDSALVFKSPDTGNVSKERLLSSQGQIAKNMKSPKPYMTESRYLGTLKVLDQKAQDTSNLEEADTIRATIYQDWITMKKKTLHEEMKRKKLEEQFQKENKKKAGFFFFFASVFDSAW
uniref:Microtubule-associated protein 9 n=1 Tax=Erpetoichthys calabaricus TaxID=27687 RepID=A0A8C4RV06_ERPCA